MSYSTVPILTVLSHLLYSMLSGNGEIQQAVTITKHMITSVPSMAEPMLMYITTSQQVDE